jgi:hypothetical protein
MAAQLLGLFCFSGEGFCFKRKVVQTLREEAERRNGACETAFNLKSWWPLVHHGEAAFQRQSCASQSAFIE